MPSTNRNLCRRVFLCSLAAAPLLIKGQLLAALPRGSDPQQPRDWSCPMDADVHLDRPGKCPRCGMVLVLHVPERIEYVLQVDVEPDVLEPHSEASLTIRVQTPEGVPVSRFEFVHEKLLHLFIVSEDLEFFEHIHPALEDDAAFHIRTRLAGSGMYRLLADYYPSGSVPQLSLSTFYVAGPASHPHLHPSRLPQQAANLKVALRMEPRQPAAGLLCRLHLDLDPYEGLELYLGAWGHMLIASEDLVDLIHTHPFLKDTSSIQFNVIFPRPGLHRIWCQLQRRGVVNTVAFTVLVASL